MGESQTNVVSVIAQIRARSSSECIVNDVHSLALRSCIVCGENVPVTNEGATLKSGAFRTTHYTIRQTDHPLEMIAETIGLMRWNHQTDSLYVVRVESSDSLHRH